MIAPAMHVHSLSKEELQYEVSIRSDVPESTVDKLRKQLKKLLVEVPADEITDAPPQSQEQFLAVQKKVHELIAKWSEFEDSRDNGSFLRARALAGHLFYRLRRVPEGESVDLRTLREKELLTVQSFIDKINGRGSGQEDLATVVTEPSSEQTQSTSGQQKVLVECTGPKVPIAKWGIKFDGIGDVRSFLERVQELSAANGTKEDKLFMSASELFSEQGLLWFRGIKDQVQSWSELASLLLEEFNPIDYDYRLLGEIISVIK